MSILWHIMNNARVTFIICDLTDSSVKSLEIGVLFASNFAPT